MATLSCWCEFLPNAGSVKTYFLILFAAFWLMLCTPLKAQKPKTKYKKGGVIQLNDSLTSYGQSDIFHFPNINKVRRYYDENKNNRLKALAKAGDYEAHYAELKAYVKNFGIENFYQDTQMLWDLARLSEKLGPAGEAILLYKLVLKHHKATFDDKEVKKEFDKITENQKDLYVPLAQYYELVAYRKEIDTLRPPQGVLLNMGYGVNSEKEDYGPTIGNVDNILLFTSKRNTIADAFKKVPNEDLFYAIKSDTVWGFSEEFKNINTQYNEGSACLSRDGKQLFFARCNSPDSYGNCDIFVADLKPDSSWGFVRNLGTSINSVSWDSQPSLSHTGDTLFFASDRIGGFGFSDIYFSVKDAAGNWGKAQNVGPIINTRGFEVSPFYHHRFNVLYFSSNGQPLNFGDFDIYKSLYKQNLWEEPKNIGPLVNGAGSEYYFTIDSESSNLYYARSAESDLKNLDLHSFPVPMEAQPNATAKLKGTLINSETKKPFRGIVSVIDLDKGVEVAPKFLREDGSFDFNLINKRNYLLIIQGDDFFRIEEIFYMEGDKEINLETEPIESKMAFKSLEFENGKADILESMHKDLDKLANFMIDHPKFHLSISGHTDSQGKEESNLRLSQARADAIKAYLIYQFKIAAGRINAHGYGSAKPLVDENTDDDRRLNRRVEFELKKEE
ncbi:OmpA family protein [Pseudochryseolinea flava]|uniref:OmpA family protein n=1 Tax=Pseudochryseolinea flava TaxID=2059302 RepID=A0A364XYB0_9BACT|nr:OmpA family protein [Pseudochryseolinea flava]